jgi:nicotinamide-nucleotide amidase
MKTIKLIAVGNEIIEGDIANAHTQTLSQQLRAAGFDIIGHEAVKDCTEDLIDAFDHAFRKADIVITTGGLGPTQDDLTKESAARYFEMPLVEHAPSMARIKLYFARFNKAMPPANRKQAFFPPDALVLDNPHGTAPGCILHKQGKHLILLPGPAIEMEAMFQTHVLPWLLPLQTHQVAYKILRVCGIGEAQIAQDIDALMGDHDGVRVAPYAKANEVLLRITACANDLANAQQKITRTETEIRQHLGRFIYGEGDTALENVVAESLIRQKLKLALAESCTGGIIAARLVSHPGISATLLEAVVCYSNASKISRLGVNPATLETFGAVSPQTAEEMALGAARTSGADIALSVTGIAGPEGGTPEKPVGLVYLGVYWKGETHVSKLQLPGLRNQVRERAATMALHWLSRILMEG